MNENLTIREKVESLLREFANVASGDVWEESLEVAVRGILKLIYEETGKEEVVKPKQPAGYKEKK